MWIRASEFFKNLFVAWAVIPAIILLVDSGSGRGLSWAVGVPGSAPFFPAAVLVGAGTGYLLNRSYRSRAARWVFVPPLLVFLLNARGDLFLISGGGWAYFVKNELSNQCMQTSCLGVAFFTMPVAAATAYAFGAWLAGQRPASALGEGFPSPPLHATLADSPAPNASLDRLARLVWSLVGYILQVALACGSAWLGARVVIGMAVVGKARPAVPGVALGALIFLISVTVPFALGATLARSKRSVASGWVWPAPVLFQFVAALSLSGTGLYGSTIHWWQAYVCACNSNFEIGLAVYSAAPAYGGIAYSLGSGWARRHPHSGSTTNTN